MGLKENVYLRMHVQLCLYSLWAHEGGKHRCELVLRAWGLIRVPEMRWGKGVHMP